MAKKLSTFSFLFLVFIATTTPASTFQQAINEIGNSDSMVGLAVAVVRHGELDFLNTYGVREYGQPEKIDAQTTFRIASLSKGFAATMASKLVEDGKLSFGSSISKYNQNFQLRDAAQARAVTLSDVLSHRLSLPPYAYDNLLEAGISPPEILQEMKKVTPICKVSTCYAYQNVGFNLITSAIESVANNSYTELVESQLFTPLNMGGASFGLDKLTSAQNWARSHRGKVVKEVKQPYYSVPAAGGVNANIRDMSKWLAAQMGHAPDVINANQLEAMHTPIVKTPAELRRNRRLEKLTDAHYGLGWRVYKYAGKTVINHSGSVEGYTAQIAFLPEQDVGIVLLANSRSREFWDILPLFLDYELGLNNSHLM